MGLVLMNGRSTGECCLVYVERLSNLFVEC